MRLVAKEMRFVAKVVEMTLVAKVAIMRFFVKSSRNMIC